MTVTKDDLQKLVDDLNIICEFDLQYLIANRKISFIDLSTLTMIQNKIEYTVREIECLIHK